MKPETPQEFIARVREYESKATKGPWETDAWTGDAPWEEPDSPFVIVTPATGEKREGEQRLSFNALDVPAALQAHDDVAFVSQSRTDVPVAVKMLEKVIDMIDRSEGNCAHEGEYIEVQHCWFCERNVFLGGNRGASNEG